MFSTVCFVKNSVVATSKCVSFLLLEVALLHLARNIIIFSLFYIKKYLKSAFGSIQARELYLMFCWLMGSITSQ